MVKFFSFVKLNFCIVFAICDLLHDVETIYCPCSLLSNRPICALISNVGSVYNRDWYEFQDDGESQHICLHILKMKGYTLVR